ncbi:conjugal transfer protein TraD [Mesorhizobium sp.]|uniref:conjugal transfer protein TraD n=1 Tax=Mesorhizobium sp. TaxID=1871066 RepID=UPI0025BD14E9|nr:conjugal transfer protein TraD [Mesorhizobium sp.]
MRKPRDFDAELKALEEKARELRTRKVQQLGELVIATGADQLSTDELAGALAAIAETKDTGKREAWAKRGVTFFESGSRRTASASQSNRRSAPAHQASPQSPAGGSGSQ